jgi:alpha-tubulin suppressor-like RCC1 family protein
VLRFISNKVDSVHSTSNIRLMNTSYFSAFTRHLLLAALFVLGFSSTAQAVKYTQISAGGGHTCAIVSTGLVHCWGKNDNGQLGNGTTVDSTSPVVVRTITTATAVSAGDNSSCAILLSGRIRCWGYNNHGQLGNGSVIDSSFPVEVNIFTSATTISVGSNFACATESGTVRCWGYGTAGQLGNAESVSSATPRSVRTAPAAAGPSGVLASVASVSVGGNHACALAINGSIRCWGEGSAGQLGDGLSTDSNIAVTVSGLAAATHVSAGNNFTCALLSSGGGGRCWGSNGAGQLGNNSTTGSDTPVTVFRQSSPSIVALNASLQLSAGGSHTCVLRTTPEMLCWGSNVWAQLGVGSQLQQQYTVAVPVSGIGTPVQFSAGTSHTCAVFANGSAQCWGSNLFGQLGIGDVGANNRPTPQWVLAPSCTLDVDDDGSVSALSDGLIMVRAMFGLSGTAVTDGLTGANATRPTWPQIRAHLSVSCGMQGLAP